MAWHLGDHATPREPRSDSQQPYDSSQSSVTPVPRGSDALLTSAGITDTCTENNQIHQIKQNLVIFFILEITKHFSHTHAFIYTCKSTFAYILSVLWYIDLFFIILIVCYITSFFKLWFCIWIYHDLPISL